jgi:hypothetical protein
MPLKPTCEFLRGEFNPNPSPTLRPARLCEDGDDDNSDGPPPPLCSAAGYI